MNNDNIWPMPIFVVVVGVFAALALKLLEWSNWGATKVQETPEAPTYTDPLIFTDPWLTAVVGLLAVSVIAALLYHLARADDTSGS